MEQAGFFPADDSKKFRLSTKKQAVTDCSIRGQRLLRKLRFLACPPPPPSPAPPPPPAIIQQPTSLLTSSTSQLVRRLLL